jgi:hypothetical protein
VDATNFVDTATSKAMMVLLAEVVERLLALEETKMASWVARPTI